MKEALGFLMTREISHQQSFEKALYSIQPNFPPGKLGGMPEFTNVYFNMSTGSTDARGPWNSAPTFEFREAAPAVDGGSGDFGVQMASADIEMVERAAVRQASVPQSVPLTGAMLGMEDLAAANVDGDSLGMTDAIDPKGAKANAEAKEVLMAK